LITTYGPLAMKEIDAGDVDGSIRYLSGGRRQWNPENSGVIR
jgi:hypothetical protein